MSTGFANNVTGGLEFQTKTCTLYNRTGAALALGDVVALNADFAATAGQAMVGLDPRLASTDGATGYLFGNAIAQTTENACRILLVSMGAIADNAAGLFGYQGILDVKVNGGNKGEYLTGTNAQVYATPLTRTEILALTTAVSNVVGIALEDTSGVATAKCLWDGAAYRSWSAGDT